MSVVCSKIKCAYIVGLCGLLGVSCGDGAPGAQQSGEEEDTAGGQDDTETGSDESTNDTGPAYDYLLIDDFEDGDSVPLSGLNWFAYDDALDNGASIIDIAENDAGDVIPDGDGYESARGLYFEYRLDQGDYEYSPYVGCGVLLGEPSSPYSAVPYDGISYAYKGNAHRVRVQIFDVVDWDHYNVEVPASKDWTTVYLPFTDFHQEGWGAAVPLNLTNIEKIGWQIRGSTGDEGSLSLDNVAFFDSLEEDEGTPDMVIRDADPPDDEVLADDEVASPLQPLAMSTLNKGYNLEEWLEESNLETSVYDEQYMMDLAANGFEAVRLPIDLDRYIENRDDYFSGAGDLTIAPELFDVLDTFEAWTATAGLSLTIDYHQTDGTFDMSNERYIEGTIGLWSGVAEHFELNERRDLFLELMNEPELAGDTGAVSQSEWTLFAQQIIDAIRDVDPDRIILFGDVNWNGIDPLVDRTPFDDDNIIYVFHFYEPFIFTHQGASWADMGTTHDIPYPYTRDRWSEYSTDFGFYPDVQLDWQFDQLNAYYRNGNKSAIRNQIILAKRWSVEHDVPIVCNEFGVYDRTSRKEDRVNYYSDIIDIFEEMNIPWQHWFSLMDIGTREVDPDLREAFNL